MPLAASGAEALVVLLAALRPFARYPPSPDSAPPTWVHRPGLGPPTLLPSGLQNDTVQCCVGADQQQRASQILRGVWGVFQSSRNRTWVEPHGHKPILGRRGPRPLPQVDPDDQTKMVRTPPTCTPNTTDPFARTTTHSRARTRSFSNPPSRSPLDAQRQRPGPLFIEWRRFHARRPFGRAI